MPNYYIYHPTLNSVLFTVESTMKCVVLLVSWILICGEIKCSNILMAFPMSSYSHFSLGYRLATELATRGHEVTFISPYPQKKNITGLTEISIEEVIDKIEEKKKSLFTLNDGGIAGMNFFVYEMGHLISKTTYKNPEVQALLRSGKKFDLFIMEHFFDVSLVGLAHLFKVPTIMVDGQQAGNMNNYVTSNLGPASYVPDQLGSFSKTMNFWQRLQNFLKIAYIDLLREMYFLPVQRKIFKKYTKSDLELDDVLYNTSLMFTNSHYSIHDAIPLVPNVVEIGGYHIAPPKGLPKDLKKFLDESAHGVIVFSMGSNLKSKDLKPEVKDALLKAFSRIKQDVLWKFETDLPNLPKNVKIMKWLPQQDVLAHPNVKAFISHGGLLSTIEAVHFGVPIIGIPVFGDQFSNILKAASSGYAVEVPLKEITEKKWSWALNEILNNPKYMTNVKYRSALMNHRPSRPIDIAIFWIEHVIRYKGAPHLRTAGSNLNWFQRELIDIYCFLVVVFIIVMKLVIVSAKSLVNLCTKSKDIKIKQS